MTNKKTILNRLHKEINAKLIVYYLTVALLGVTWSFNKVILFAILSLALTSKKRGASNQKIALFIALLVFLSFSFLKTNHVQKKRQALHQVNKIDPEKNYDIYFLEPCTNYNTYVQAKIIKNNIRILIYVDASFSTLPKYADIYKVSHKKIATKIQRNPNRKNSKTSHLNKNYIAKVHINKSTLIKKGSECPIKKQAFLFRKKITHFYKKLPLKEERDLLISLIIGNKTIQLPKKISVAYKKLGLTHLLVVSGSQVALLSTLFYTLLRQFLKKKYLILILIFLFQTVFYFITGGGISLMRAILFNSLCLINKTMSNTLNTTHLICLTSLILLAIDPFMVTDISAQLSFAATLSLLYGVPAIIKTLPSSLSKAKNFIAILLAPFIFTAPILAFHFYTISPLSILSNALLIILIECIVVIGFITTLLGIVGVPLSTLILTGLLLIIKGTNSLIFKLSTIPYATLATAAPPLALIFMLYILIYLSIIAIHNQSKKLKIYCKTVVILLLCWGLVYQLLPNPFYTITFIDVGQGDSTLISTPQKKHILIDTGGLLFKKKSPSLTYAEKAILPLLKYYGINTLDALIISHYDRDHSGGLFFLKNELPIKHILDNGNPKQAQLKKHTIPYKQTLHIGKNASLNQLHPISYNKGESKNNNSLVLKLIIKEISFLFTGDIEYKQEQSLTKKIGPKLKTTVLKVSHHGSKTSSSTPFLNKAKPLISVISCSKNNRYGHPNTAVLQRLKQHQSHILRTDQSGAIIFKTDGKKLYYKTII